MMINNTHQISTSMEYLSQTETIMGSIHSEWVKKNCSSLEMELNLSADLEISYYNDNNTLYLGYGDLANILFHGRSVVKNNIITFNTSTLFAAIGVNHYSSLVIVIDYPTFNVIEFFKYVFKKFNNVKFAFCFDAIYMSENLVHYEEFMHFIAVIIAKSVHPNYLGMVLNNRLKFRRPKNMTLALSLLFKLEQRKIHDCFYSTDNCILILNRTKGIEAFEFRINSDSFDKFKYKIINNIHLLEVIKIEDKLLFIYQSQYAFPVRATKKDGFPHYDLVKYSSGADLNEGVAKLKCEMEALERYFSMSPWPDIMTSFEKFDEFIHLNPTIFPRYNSVNLSNREIGLDDFDYNKEYYWIHGNDEITDKPIAIHSDLIVYPPMLDSAIYNSNSNGFAIHDCVVNAKLNALYELIERDNLLFSFNLKQENVQIDIDTLPEDLLVFYDEIKNIGYEPVIIYTTHDIKVHSLFVMAVNTSNNEQPFLITSASSHIDLITAVRKAFVELIVGVSYAVKKKTWRKYNGFDEIISLSDHCAFYYERSSHSFIKDLLNSRKISANSLANYNTNEPLRYLKQEFIRNNLTLYSATREINFLDGKKLYLSKMLSPDLLPMDFGYKFRRIDLKNISKRMAVKDIAFAAGRVNIAHPFA